MQGDSGRLGLACVTAEAGSIGSHIAQRTGERGPAHGLPAEKDRHKQYSTLACSTLGWPRQ